MADENISYVGVLHRISIAYYEYAHKLWHRGINFPQDLYSDWLKYGEISSREVVYTVILALFFTVLRGTLTYAVFQPISRYFQLLPINQQKFPESVWKGSYCAFIWGLQFYVLVYPGNYDYFYDAHVLWREWSPRAPLPADLYAIYIIQAGFYLHSIYAALYMDHWRRDGHVLVFHHLLTLSLLVFSYAARYQAIGVLLLFLHDFCDVCLEFSKCNVYFKNRGGRYYKIHDTFATIGFLAFTFVWYIGRLYLCPMKVIYSAACSTNVIAKEMGFEQFPFYLFFNLMLLALQSLNIYWFMYILNLLYKVATGQLKELDDVREDDVQEKITSNTNHTNKHHTNGNTHRHHENGLKHRTSNNGVQANNK